jgi:hypothetical protein
MKIDILLLEILIFSYITLFFNENIHNEIKLMENSIKITVGTVY